MDYEESNGENALSGKSGVRDDKELCLSFFFLLNIKLLINICIEYELDIIDSSIPEKWIHHHIDIANIKCLKGLWGLCNGVY